MVAHRSQLLRLVVGLICSIVDCLGRPYADVTILSQSVHESDLMFGTRRIGVRTACCCDQSVAVWRHMATIDFEIFLLAWRRCCQNIDHLLQRRFCVQDCVLSVQINIPPCVSHTGLIRCMAVICLEVVAACRRYRSRAGAKGVRQCV